MARARRQPPLFEVLHEASRRGDGSSGSGSALSPGTGLRAVQVAPKAPPKREEIREVPPLSAAREAPVREAPVEPPVREVPEPVGPASDPHWQNNKSMRLSQTHLLMAIAAVMVLVALTWVVAFKQGEGAARAELGLGTSDEPPNTGVTDPIAGRTSEAGPTSVQQPPRERRVRQQPVVTTPPASDPGPAPVGEWIPGTEPRVPAHNYLIIVRLNYRDAEAVARFLTENGVPAAAAPESESKSVDPKAEMAKNTMHVVFPLQGFPSDGFRACTQERAALRAKVLELGKRWKSQVGGSEDFSGSYWDRFR